MYRVAKLVISTREWDKEVPVVNILLSYFDPGGLMPLGLGLLTPAQKHWSCPSGYLAASEGRWGWYMGSSFDLDLHDAYENRVAICWGLPPTIVRGGYPLEGRSGRRAPFTPAKEGGRLYGNTNYLNLSWKLAWV
jgi:hypothetical protein